MRASLQVSTVVVVVVVSVRTMTGPQQPATSSGAVVDPSLCVALEMSD